ncbi:radical SAM/SPASM domain-containing protein [Marinimicrobium agarilyticum]|uniref:radical SAM/SPASM domain-containing protein n=1 Tax=Marinimicrobium agarilyticum TaxID=306546 RepID=UPI0004810784|nr:radical SAM protein [Marinimicrobium agarilyticum]
MQPIPEYAYSWRPYANPGLISRAFTGPDTCHYRFIIDPWTQNWVITEPVADELLAMCNGKRRFSEIMRKLENENENAESFDLSELALQLRKREILFCNANDHKLSGRPVYNTCDFTGLHIEITNACNMTCTHCYVSSGKPMANEMDWDTIYDTVDSLPPHSGRRIAISGGEPIVRKGCMSLVEYCVRDCGHDVDLYTNGRKFPKRFAEQISDLNKRHSAQIRLQVSLEGANEITNDLVRGTGSFKDACESLAMFQELGLGPQVVLFVCLTKHNIHQVEQIIALAEEYSAGMLVFSQWQRQGNAEDTPWESIAPANKDWVRAGDIIANYRSPTLQVHGNFYGDLGNNEIGRFSLDSQKFPKHVYYYNAFPRITPQGDVLADQMWVDQSWMLGNVKNETLDMCFRKPQFYEQLYQMYTRSDKISECKACAWRELCESGSPGHTYAEYGHMDEKDLFCEVRKYWFERYIEHHINKAFGTATVRSPVVEERSSSKLIAAASIL